MHGMRCAKCRIIGLPLTDPSNEGQAKRLAFTFVVVSG